MININIFNNTYIEKINSPHNLPYHLDVNKGDL